MGTNTLWAFIGLLIFVGIILKMGCTGHDFRRSGQTGQTD